jgi:hypothetical protein
MSKELWVGNLVKEWQANGGDTKILYKFHSLANLDVKLNGDIPDNGM